MKPLSSSHSMMPAMPSTLPGAAESACVATNSRAGTRCSAALTVVSSTDGLVAALDAREPRQRGHALRHDAGIAATRGRRAGSPRPGIPASDVGREERQRARQSAPCAGRRGRSRQAKSPAPRAARRPRARDRRAPGLRRRRRLGRASAACRAQQVGGRFGHRRSRRSLRVKIAQPPEQSGVELERHRFGADAHRRTSADPEFRASARYSSSSPSLKPASALSAKRPSTRSISRMPRCQAAEQQPPPPLVQTLA